MNARPSGSRRTVDQAGGTEVHQWDKHQLELVSDMDSAITDERWDDFSRIADGYFFALSISRPDEIADVWARVPQDWLRAHPRYLMAAAICDSVRKPFPMIDAEVERLFEEWVLGSGTPAVRDLLGLQQALIRRHLASGRFEAASDAADLVESILRSSPHATGLDDVLPTVLLRVGMVRLLSGEVRRAIASFSESWRWSMSLQPHPFAPFAADYCALAHALAGDYVQAALWREFGTDAERITPGTLAHRYSAAGPLTDALLAIGSFDRAAAEASVARLSRGVQTGELWWLVVHARAKTALYWGERAHAVREIEQVIAAFPSLTSAKSLAGLMLRADLSDLYQALGKFELAEDALGDQDWETPPHGALVSSMTRLLTLQGRHERAIEFLDEASDTAIVRAGTPVRWLVLRANLEYLTDGDGAAVAAGNAADSLAHTGAYEAAAEALPAVAALLSAHPQTDVPPVESTIFGHSLAHDLTQRERELLHLLYTHSSVRELAEAMYISPNTAKSHLQNLYRKLGAKNRIQALRIGRREQRHGGAVSASEDSAL